MEHQDDKKDHTKDANRSSDSSLEGGSPLSPNKNASKRGLSFFLHSTLSAPTSPTMEKKQPLPEPKEEKKKEEKDDHSDGKRSIGRKSRFSFFGRKQSKGEKSQEPVNLSEMEKVKTDKLFGLTIEEIMITQKHIGIEGIYPAVLDVFAETFVKIGAFEKEGIFRQSGNIAELNTLKTDMNKKFWSSAKYDVPSKEPFVVAQLFLTWFSELPEPLIPNDHFIECASCNNFKDCLAALEKLPKIHQDTIIKIIKILQEATQPSCIEKTKMGVHNIAIIFAPLILPTPASFSDEHLIDFSALGEDGDVRFLKNLIGHSKFEDVKYEDLALPPVPPLF